MTVVLSKGWGGDEALNQVVGWRKIEALLRYVTPFSLGHAITCVIPIKTLALQIILFELQWYFI